MGSPPRAHNGTVRSGEQPTDNEAREPPVSLPHNLKSRPGKDMESARFYNSNEQRAQQQNSPGFRHHKDRLWLLIPSKLQLPGAGNE